VEESWSNNITNIDMVRAKHKMFLSTIMVFGMVLSPSIIT